jgi:hypothetical protein
MDAKGWVRMTTWQLHWFSTQPNKDIQIFLKKAFSDLKKKIDEKLSKKYDFFLLIFPYFVSIFYLISIFRSML